MLEMYRDALRRGCVERDRIGLKIETVLMVY
jgi:hypothetical protein